MTGPCAFSETKFVCAMADAHRHELGFIPHSVYDAALQRDTLRVKQTDGEWTSFLLHGPLKFETKIWQTFTIEHLRRQAVATELVRELLERMRQQNLERVTCRVADDLEAVAFWKQCGFEAIGSVPTDDVWKRPLTRYEFIFAAGQQIDAIIAAARKRGKTQQLLNFFATGEQFDRTLKRKARRER